MIILQKRAAEEKVRCEEEIENSRKEIVRQESTLVVVFKELISHDFYLADNFFDPEVAQTDFTVPLETFWKPVEFPERVVTNLDDERYQKTIGAVKTID